MTSERESALASVKAKQQAFLQEAQVARQLPKHSFRQRLAQALRNWAEALEPSRVASRRMQSA